MGSLDVESSLTNIFPDETIDICTNTIYSEQDVIEGINKEEFQISFFYHELQKNPIFFSKRFYINKRMKLQWVLP